MTDLSAVPVGATIRVTGYTTDSPYTAQLKRLGLVPGTEVKILRRAPLGDPMHVRLRGYSLAIRPAEASALAFEVVCA